jgi:hypothetical protein
MIFCVSNKQVRHKQVSHKQEIKHVLSSDDWAYIHLGDLYSGGLYSGGGAYICEGLIFGMRLALVCVVGLLHGGGLYLGGGGYNLQGLW